MKSYRIYATCDIGEEGLKRLTDRGYQVEVYPDVEPPPKALIVEKVASGIDGLITTLRDPIDEEVFQAGAGTLKVVSQIAVGVDNIDEEAARKYRVPYTHTAVVLTDATAEFAFFIMGCVSRKLYPSERLVREGRWETWHPYLPFLGDEVTGKTVAVIGTGRIGRAFLLKCTGLDADILCCDLLPEDRSFVESVQALFDFKYEQGLSDRRATIRWTSFEEAFRQADYISMHVPLTPETHHLIDDEALEMMKPTAYLINTSRGPVVDPEALVRALRQGQIAGAALDVFEQEPLPIDSPMQDPDLVDRLRIFHHFASAGRRTRLSGDPDLGMAGRTAQGIIDVLEGNYGGDPSKMPYVFNKSTFA